MKRLFGYCCILLLFACEQPRKRSISFYYWQTGFRLGETEKQAIKYNGVRQLYVRYCDIDIRPGEARAELIAPLRMYTPVEVDVVPVVFIKNRVFETINDIDSVAALADSVFAFVNSFNKANGLRTGMIQFDCDWTERTRKAYFDFLQRYRQLSTQPISATIRLHQVKYFRRTGVPPVDHAVLMYYNMGKIDAGQQNSIYDEALAARYTPYISQYPLQMDVAMPVFSWAIKIRNGRVEQLLNKIYFFHFQNDSNFNAISSNRFVTRNACFRAGYYFAKNDIVKIENVTADQLLTIASRLSDHPKKIRDLIFYDLDSSNLVQYEKDIFKKVLDRFR